jgi:hypothetical protein
MFRNLPPANFSESALLKLGESMVSTQRQFKEDDVEANPEESKVPAGYTYLGQFITHDLTFDPVSSLQRDNDPEALVNFRTPRFDLDSVYGRGPVDQPYLYEQDGIHMLLGELLQNKKDYDVPRVTSMKAPSPSDDCPKCPPDEMFSANTEYAIIGDPRNDENVIISQLHGIFLRFHNQLTDELKREKKKHDFAKVQQLVRWHYQWVVLDDYLRRLVNEETYNEVLPHVAKKTDVLRDPPKLLFYKVKEQAFIPIEFSAAAFRFGHPMVRRTYRLNRDNTGLGGPFDVLGNPDPAMDLRGFRRFNRGWAIEWDLFFDRIAITEQKKGTINQVQFANTINPSLSKPLETLPPSLTKNDPLPSSVKTLVQNRSSSKAPEDPSASLALRDLFRGWRFGLPSGQAVARAMGQTPIEDDDLKVGDRAVYKISAQFTDNVPLWCYVLAEAAQKCGGNQLGPVGGRIVMETFVGLMMEDGHSFLRQHPSWKPNEVEKDPEAKFWMAEFIKKAISGQAEPLPNTPKKG